MPKIRTEYARKSFYYTGATIYNELPLKIRKIKNATEYEKSLKDCFSLMEHFTELNEPAVVSCCFPALQRPKTKPSSLGARAYETGDLRVVALFTSERCLKISFSGKKICKK